MQKMIRKKKKITREKTESRKREGEIYIRRRGRREKVCLRKWKERGQRGITGRKR